MRKLWERWGEEKGKRLVLILLAVGLLLMLFPTGMDKSAGSGDTEEARLAAFLSAMDGVGESRVLLSERGAAVVCDGAASPSTVLDITEAVRCYTGLGADRVKIFLKK